MSRLRGSATSAAAGPVPGLPGSRARRQLRRAGAGARLSPLAGSTAPPAANLRLPPCSGGGAGRGGQRCPLAIGCGPQRPRCDRCAPPSVAPGPAPPRFITDIPMAEAGNLPRRERAEPGGGTRRCRAEGQPPGRAAAGGVPPLLPCPPPRDDGAAGLAQRGGSPVPAGAAAVGVSASGSRPPSHGAPGKLRCRSGGGATPLLPTPPCRLAFSPPAIPVPQVKPRRRRLPVPPGRSPVPPARLPRAGILPRASPLPASRYRPDAEGCTLV